MPWSEGLQPDKNLIIMIFISACLFIKVGEIIQNSFQYQVQVVGLKASLQISIQ